MFPYLFKYLKARYKGFKVTGGETMLSELQMQWSQEIIAKKMNDEFVSVETFNFIF
jgi:hypothetical protein